MPRSVLALGVVVALLCAVAALPEADEVKSLPGWDYPLKSRVFAGYVDAGEDSDYKMHEHYVFVESELNPATDPVILWTNGGPGAASFFGLFTELGPYMLSDLSLLTEDYNKTGVPTLMSNPYSWTKVASVVILNSPPPVGFSYCDPVGPSGDGTSCGEWNDERTAHHNRIFVENFFKVFPEYAKNDFYIIGESYAGVYVPMLAEELLEHKSEVNLKGVAVGDGCAGKEVLCGVAKGPWFGIEFMHGHGQFSDKLYNKIRSTCSDEELKMRVTSEDCKALLQEMNEEIGGYFVYGLYDSCWYENDLSSPRRLGWHEVQEKQYWGPPPFRTISTEPNQEGSDYECGGFSALKLWTHTPEVRKALHVADDAFFFSGDNGEGFTYNVTYKNAMTFYHKVIADQSLRVLIYNGDADPSINSLVSQNWTVAMGLEEEQRWRPWTIDGREYMGGYVTRYAGGFDFLTIRGAGHMVPEVRSKVSLEFIKKWIRDEDWPRYDPSSRRK